MTRYVRGWVTVEIEREVGIYLRVLQMLLRKINLLARCHKSTELRNVPELTSGAGK